VGEKEQLRERKRESGVRHNGLLNMSSAQEGLVISIVLPMKAIIDRARVTQLSAKAIAVQGQGGTERHRSEDNCLVKGRKKPENSGNESGRYPPGMKRVILK